jgi:hypothetical protein
MAVATIPTVPATSTVTPGRFWMIRIGYGLMLGVAITTLNFAHNFPRAPAPDNLGFPSFVLLLLEWCGEGILLASIVGLAERWVSPRELRTSELALAVVIGAIAAVLFWQTFIVMVLHEVLGIRLFRDYLGAPVIWIIGVFFQIWLMLFFGGLAAAVYASRQRRARMRAALFAAELGRAIAQQRLAESRLASLQARVEPEYLFQTLSRLEEAYKTDPHTADRLLDELIAFLRDVVTDIRASTLSAVPVETQGGDEPPVMGTFIVEKPA